MKKSIPISIITDVQTEVYIKQTNNTELSQPASQPTSQPSSQAASQPLNMRNLDVLALFSRLLTIRNRRFRALQGHVLARFPRPLTIRNRRFRGLQGRVLALFPRLPTIRNRRFRGLHGRVLAVFSRPPTIRNRRIGAFVRCSQRLVKHSKCFLRHVPRETCRNRLPAARPSPLAAVRIEIAASGIEPEAFPRRSRNHALDHSAKPALPGLGGLLAVQNLLLQHAAIAHGWRSQ